MPSLKQDLAGLDHRNDELPKTPSSRKRQPAGAINYNESSGSDPATERGTSSAKRRKSASVREINQDCNNTNHRGNLQSAVEANNRRYQEFLLRRKEPRKFAKRTPKKKETASLENADHDSCSDTIHVDAPALSQTGIQKEKDSSPDPRSLPRHKGYLWVELVPDEKNSDSHSHPSVQEFHDYTINTGPENRAQLQVRRSPERKLFRMAPTYSNRPNRRQNRAGVIDHDIYDGIPVRQWRRENVTVAPPPDQENTNAQNDIWAVELPHGMPKDSHLLPQHSQDLLRAARSGKIYRRPVPVEEEEADADVILDGKPEKKEEDPKEKGFVAKAWKPVPRHLDLTDNDFLAKKRKNLVPMKPVALPVVATLTKTTVKRVDAAGNEYVQELVVPHGQKVEGEVISQTEIPDPNASLLIAHPTPPKRKGIKKKLKGPGRGRKKKPLEPAPTSVPTDAPVDGAAPLPVENGIGLDGVKVEDASATPTNNEDTEMGDGSNVNSDEDDGDDDDEGDEGEIDEGSDAQQSPAKRPRTTSPPRELPPVEPIPGLSQTDIVMGGIELPGPARLLAEREKSEGKTGSPLKTVALTASALASPQVSPTFSSPAESFPAPSESIPSAMTTHPEIANLDEAMQEKIADSAPTTLPSPPPAPTEVEVDAAKEMLREEEEEEEMLLDIAVENTGNAQIGEPQIPEPEPVAMPAVTAEPTESVEPPQSEEILAEPAVEEVKRDEMQTSEPIEPVESVEPAVEPTSAEPTLPEPATETAPAEPAAEEDDDDYQDLLGGLEKSLQ